MILICFVTHVPQTRESSLIHKAGGLVLISSISTGTSWRDGLTLSGRFCTRDISFMHWVNLRKVTIIKLTFRLLFDILFNRCILLPHFIHWPRISNWSLVKFFGLKECIPRPEFHTWYWSVEIGPMSLWRRQNIRRGWWFNILQHIERCHMFK